jgi:hypothetical protein
MTPPLSLFVYLTLTMLMMHTSQASVVGFLAEAAPKLGGMEQGWTESSTALQHT